jgi:3',5'-cyclic AMP phosphodiesterase CpdA
MKIRNICKIFVLIMAIQIFAIPAHTKEKNLKFAVISDIRMDGIRAAMEFIKSQDADFIIVPGDFYYSQKGYYSRFSDYGYGVDPRKEPDQQGIYFAIGNHDDPPSGDNFFKFYIAKAYPKNGPQNAPEGTIYSFDRGNCHFVVTNPYWDQPEGKYTQTQLGWLAQDLSKSSQTFKFVVGHEPAFPLKKHVGDSLDAEPANRDALWKILADNGAQAFFCGHTHNLSHVMEKGVYQFDAGAVNIDDMSVTIVEISSADAIVSSYKTADNSLEPEKNASDTGDLVHRTIVYAMSKEKPDDVLHVLYSADSSAGQENAKNSFFSCFIGAIQN